MWLTKRQCQFYYNINLKGKQDEKLAALRDFTDLLKLNQKGNCHTIMVPKRD